MALDADGSEDLSGLVGLGVLIRLAVRPGCRDAASDEADQSRGADGGGKVLRHETAILRRDPHSPARAARTVDGVDDGERFVAVFARDQRPAPDAIAAAKSWNCRSKGVSEIAIGSEAPEA